MNLLGKYNSLENFQKHLIDLNTYKDFIFCKEIIISYATYTNMKNCFKKLAFNYPLYIYYP